MTCDDLIAIEETTLQFLSENIGTESTFRPACAYVDEDAIDVQITRAADGRVAEATALRVAVTYTTTAAFEAELEAKRQEVRRSRLRGGDGRDLQVRGGLCGTTNHHLCCAQQSINVDGGGAFCRSTGCDISDCKKPTRPRPALPGRPGGMERPGAGRPRPGARPPARPARNTRERSLPPPDERELQAQTWTCARGKLASSSFNAAVRRRTAFANSEMVHALLNDTDTGLVARCSTNWYVVMRGGVPSVTCDEFRSLECDGHQDLEFDAADVACLEPSAAPSAMPSAGPSVSAAPSISAAPSASSSPSLVPSAASSLGSSVPLQNQTQAAADKGGK